MVSMPHCSMKCHTMVSIPFCTKVWLAYHIVHEMKYSIEHSILFYEMPYSIEHTTLYYEMSYSCEHTILCHRPLYFVEAGAGMPDMNPILPLSTVPPSKSCWPARPTDQKILKIFQTLADVSGLSWKFLVLLRRTVELTKACNLAKPHGRVDPSQVTWPT